MSDSRLVFKLQSLLQREARTVAKLEELLVAQRTVQDTLASVACAFTWDLVFGNPMPTDKELDDAARGVGK